jgi:hypothetical protein
MLPGLPVGRDPLRQNPFRARLPAHKPHTRKEAGIATGPCFIPHSVFFIRLLFNGHMENNIAAFRMQVDDIHSAGKGIA